MTIDAGCKDSANGLAQMIERNYSSIIKHHNGGTVQPAVPTPDFVHLCLHNYEPSTRPPAHPYVCTYNERKHSGLAINLVEMAVRRLSTRVVDKKLPADQHMLLTMEDFTDCQITQPSLDTTPAAPAPSIDDVLRKLGIFEAAMGKLQAKGVDY